MCLLTYYHNKHTFWMYFTCMFEYTIDLLIDAFI